MQEIKEYLELTEEIHQKKNEFDQSIAELQKELDARYESYRISTREIQDRRFECRNAILRKGREILKKIQLLFYREFRDCSITSAENAFHLLFCDRKETDEYYECVDLFCNIRTVKTITDTHIIFGVEECYNPEDCVFGEVGIPIKYFETDCLDDKDFISEVHGQARKETLLKESEETE